LFSGSRSPSPSSSTNSVRISSRSGRAASGRNSCTADAVPASQVSSSGIGACASVPAGMTGALSTVIRNAWGSVPVPEPGTSAIVSVLSSIVTANPGTAAARRSVAFTPCAATEPRLA